MINLKTHLQPRLDRLKNKTIREFMKDQGFEPCGFGLFKSVYGDQVYIFKKEVYVIA